MIKVGGGGGGSGSVTEDGSGTAGEIAIWSSATGLRGDPALTVHDDANNFILQIVDTKTVQVGFSVANDGTGPVRCTFATAGGGAADTELQISNQIQIWSIGLDNSNGDCLAISAAGSLGTDDAMRISTTKTVSIAAGGSTAFGVVGGVVHVNTTPVGNVGGGTDDLMSYTIPADLLNVTGRVIRVTMRGIKASNGNAKSLQIVYDGTNVATIAALATNGATPWEAVLTIVRTGSNTQDVYAHVSDANNAGAFSNDNGGYLAGTSTDTAGIPIKATCSGVANNDVTQRLLMVEVLN